MGKTMESEEEVMELIQMTEADWPGKSYDVLTRNCCHYCDELCQQLGVGEVPAWVLNLAGAGAAVLEAGDFLKDTQQTLASATAALGAYFCCNSCGGPDRAQAVPFEEVEAQP